MKNFSRYHNFQGFTLIELIVAMVVISVALVGVMSVINLTVLHSADPVLRQQSIAIAESYMEEIVLQGYFDPDTVSPVEGTDECPPEEPSRDLYDNVCDYDGLNDHGARDQNDHPISGLENYDVKVEVIDGEDAKFGPSGVEVRALKIVVTVTDPGGEELSLIGYRTDY